MSDPIKNRYDFVLLFDVLDGNPNGDPDAGNLPRIDPETGHGLVTDVCLKRKIRNRIQLAQANKPGYDIFIQEKAILNNVMVATGTEHPDPADPSQILPELGTPDSAKGDAKAKGVQDRTTRMCETFFDIRAFGAVLTTKPKAKNKLDYTGGQVRGPIQFTFARSVDPIVTLEHAITRMAVATEEEAEKQSGDNRTMGRKNTVPYGLYAAHGFIVPSFAARTGFSEERRTCPPASPLFPKASSANDRPGEYPTLRTPALAGLPPPVRPYPHRRRLGREPFHRRRPPHARTRPRSRRRNP